MLILISASVCRSAVLTPSELLTRRPRRIGSIPASLASDQPLTDFTPWSFTTRIAGRSPFADGREPPDRRSPGSAWVISELVEEK
jgi:hypothetical protein